MKKIWLWLELAVLDTFDLQRKFNGQNLVKMYFVFMSRHYECGTTSVGQYIFSAGLDVATCRVANATRFGPLATNFSLVVASLATAISRYY